MLVEVWTACPIVQPTSCEKSGGRNTSIKLDVTVNLSSSGPKIGLNALRPEVRRVGGVHGMPEQITPLMSSILSMKRYSHKPAGCPRLPSRARSLVSLLHQDNKLIEGQLWHLAPGQAGNSDQ